MKKRLFFDMDNVLVNFESGIGRLDSDTRRAYEGRLDEVPGIFSLIDLIPGASEFKGEWIQFGLDRFPDWSTIQIQAHSIAVSTEIVHLTALCEPRRQGKAA